MKAGLERRGEADAPARVPLRVLIVEDSEDDALLLLRELERGGYKPIHERVDTPEELRRALAEGGPWDVVLSDWRMPRFEAPEALAIFHATGSEAPFIIVSGKVGEELAVEGMKAGAHDYVMKDNLTRLCATVERGLEEAQARHERKRAEEERDHLFEFSLDLLCVASTDGYLKRVNPAFEETLGYSREELLAKPFIEFVHPEDRVATMSELQSQGRGARTAYFENRYLRKDGSQVWLAWKAVPVLEKDLIYATARDVTERKRDEEELHRREGILRAVAFAAECFLKKAASWEESIEEVLERLGRAAEVSRVYVFETYRGEDGELWGTQRYEWVATGVSAQMDNPLMQAIPYRAAGYGRWAELLSQGELVHGHTKEFSEEEQRELWEQDILSIVIVPIFVEGEWWGLIGFDECTSEREWSAAEIDALKAAADTLGAAIGRTRAEQALRESEERFRATFDQAAVGVAHVSPHGSWLRVNEKLCEIVGYSREELLELTLQDITHPDDLEADLAYQGRLLAGEISRYSMEKRYFRKAGSVIWIDLTVSLVRAPSGEPKYFIAILEDITERKRAGEALVQSEERYRAVVEQAAEGIFLFEAATGDVLESNAAFQELLDYTAQELLGMKLYDLVAHDREGIDRNIQRILDEGSRFVGERRYRCKDGSLVDVEVTASLISYAGRKVICTVIRDVTERKQAERALRQSEQLYRTVIEQAAEYIYLIDTETRRILQSNPAFREALGYTREELGHMTLYDIVAHDRESIDRNARRVLERGRYFVGERKYRRKDGSLIDVETSSSTILYDGREVFCVVGHDVTERRRKEEELRESQRALYTLMSNLPGMAYRCRNDPDWTMEFVSEGCSELTGYPPPDLVGNWRRSYGDLIHPDDREEVWESVQAALRERRPFQLTYRITTASGAVRWAWEQGRGIFSPEGELLVLEGFITDTTERKRARDELAQSEERYRAVVEQATEGIFLCDAATGEVLESNTAFRELLGYTAGELRGIKIHDLVDDDRENIDSNLRLILDEGSRFVGERRYRRKDGSLVDVEAAASVISYGGRKVICDVIRDVTERVEAFRLLEERVTALAGISASLTVGQTMEATLDALAARVVQSTAAVACTVVLIDTPTGLPRTAGSHGLPEGYTAALQAAYRNGLRPAPMEVFRTHRPILVRDARQRALNQPLAASVHRYLRQAPWDPIYCVPLIYRAQALGTLNLYYLPGHEPGEDESVFLGAIADQTAVAVENAHLFTAAQDTAALEERQRLARELHDSVSQALYGIVLGTDAARTLVDRDPERIIEPLEYVLSLAKAGLAEMRALIFELRPESLESEGLIAALEKQAALVQARHELAVHLTLCDDEPDAPLEVKEAVYRIAQEALNNTVKHAQARSVELLLERDAGELLLEVRDDGEGFDAAGTFPGHLGLKSMRERVARLGGTLRIESAPGEGTRIRVQISPAT